MSILNYTEELQKYNLTPDKFEQICKDIDAKLNGELDIDWSELCCKYELGFAPDTIRKASSSVPFGAKFRLDYYKEKLYKDSDGYSRYSELDEKLHEIKKEKQKLSDERSALNKTLRENSRYEEDLSILRNLIQENSYKPSIKASEIYQDGDNDLFVCLSDLHLGLDVDTNFGKYNSEIAEKRLSRYLAEIIRIKLINNSKNVYVGILGDILNGEIHFTTQLENRENLTEQVQKSAEMISAFVYELSKHFDKVYVNGVAGNHSRTSYKDQVLRGNRLDNLIPWYMKAKLSNFNNVIFIDDNNYDSTIATCTIRGHEYWMVHGDFDSYSESGVSKLVLMLKHSPTAIFYGHLHKCSYDDISGIKIIRSGCFCGTSDDYTISKRISGNASQMVCVVTDEGIESCYPVKLS